MGRSQLTSDQYFYKSVFQSEIQDKIFDLKESFSWTRGRKYDQFQVSDFDQSLIEQDTLLNYLHGFLQGKISLFKFPPYSNYRWHRDGDNLFNLNLVFVEQRSFTVFEKLPRECKVEEMHRSVKSVKELIYQPRFWYIFNAQIEHTIFNLDESWRYLLTYNVPIDSKYSYYEIVEMVKNYDR